MDMERAFDDLPIEDEGPHWTIRAAMRVERWARPWLGWGALAACMLLSLLPAAALRANHWLDLGNLQPRLEWSGPLAVLAVWLIWGWRRPRARGRGWLRGIGILLLGPVVISQVLLGWLPGPGAWLRAAMTGGWAQIGPNMAAVWLQAAARVQLWWEGVVAGGAAQDNLVFAASGSLVLWIVGTLCGWLARRTQQGFAAAAAPLWLLTLILLYSREGRYLLIMGLALTLGLHLLLDHRRLVARWQAQHLDFSPGLLADRLMAAVGAAMVILALAAVMPNLYVQSLVNSYYQLLGPANARIEALGERLFPDVRGTSRLRGGSGGGMPNAFLLQGGPDLGNAVIMRVRTDESATYQFPFDEMAAPPGHYMRGATFAEYDGRGWSNPPNAQSRQIIENQAWQEDELWGRKVVVQTVIMAANTTLLFAAPEPVEASVPVRLEERDPGDQVRIYARQQSYAVVSAVPAVNETMLRELPFWSAELPLPAGYNVHLQLPEQVSERTRGLAEELTTGQPTAYDKALAIEIYLRQFPYDLEVAAPPEDVVEVADYFLFELGRGYCDYYATAFVVLARLAGLPARFATGYAVGAWDPIEAVFVVTEAEAHSWPEVYFPQVGWVPFEPTAGRPTLARVAVPSFESTGAIPAAVPAPPTPEVAPARWNWQMVVWIVPVVLLVWGGWWSVQQWRRRREDPWLTLLKWGRGAGRPMHEGETVLEYGRGLADFVVTHAAGAQDTTRVVAREIEAVSAEVNASHYAPVGARSRAQQAILQRWERLRSYLPMVRLR